MGQSGFALTLAVCLGWLATGVASATDLPMGELAPIPEPSALPDDATNSPFARSPNKFLERVAPLPSMKRNVEDELVEDKALAELALGPRLGALLDTIDGAKSLTVVGADGKTRVLPEGGRVLIGDVIKISPDQAARLVFESEAQVLLGAGSEVSLVEERPAEGAEKIPTLEVRHGEVRALVPPSAEPIPGEEEKGEPSPRPSPAPSASASAPARSPLRFLVRTPAAVMGVRGTDFVVGAMSAEETTVYTLNGSVDVASDVDQLRRGDGVAIAGGRFTNAYSSERGVNRGRTFDPATYLLRFHERHRKLEAMWKTAAREHQTGRLRYRLERLKWERSGKRRQGSDAGFSAAPPLDGPPPATKSSKKAAPHSQPGAQGAKKRKSAWNREILREFEEPPKPKKKLRKRRPGR